MRPRPPDVLCQRLQVLHNGCEVELVARTGEPPQAHAFEAMMGLEVRKRISTFLRSSRDLSNSGGPINARAWSRVFSLRSRGILRCGVFGQHLGLIGHELQLRKLVR